MRFVLVHSHLARRAHTDRIGASKARTCADPDSPLWIDSPLHAARLTPSVLHSLAAFCSSTAAASLRTLSLAHRPLAPLYWCCFVLRTRADPREFRAHSTGTCMYRVRISTESPSSTGTHVYCCTIACTVVNSLDVPVSHTGILY